MCPSEGIAHLVAMLGGGGDASGTKRKRTDRLTAVASVKELTGCCAGSTIPLMSRTVALESFFTRLLKAVKLATTNGYLMAAIRAGDGGCLGFMQKYWQPLWKS